MRRLVLFDIDGTLLSAGGVSARALESALVETFGTSGAAAGYDYSGKTDPQIVRELMRGAGFDDPAIERAPAARARALPGVPGGVDPPRARPGEAGCPRRCSRRSGASPG